MIFPHNSFPADHTTGLKMPLKDYLAALCATRWLAEGELQIQGLTDGATTTGTISIESASFERPNLTTSPLYWDFPPTEEDLREELKYFPPEGDPHPWTIYGVDPKFYLENSILARQWYAKSHLTIESDNDTATPDDESYMIFGLPFGGGSHVNDAAKGMYAGLDYANPSAEIVIAMLSWGPVIFSPDWGGNPIPLMSLLGSAEWQESAFADLFSSYDDAAVTWQTLDIAKFLIGSNEFTLTAKLPVCNYTKGSGDKKKPATVPHIVSSSLVFTAYWD
ncbi:MAG: hypothetical protein QM680_13700 [Luteolibacter sp.]